MSVNGKSARSHKEIRKNHFILTERNRSHALISFRDNKKSYNFHFDLHDNTKNCDKHRTTEAGSFFSYRRNFLDVIRRELRPKYDDLPSIRTGIRAGLQQYIFERSLLTLYGYLNP